MFQAIVFARLGFRCSRSPGVLFLGGTYACGICRVMGIDLGHRFPIRVLVAFVQFHPFRQTALLVIVCCHYFNVISTFFVSPVLVAFFLSMPCSTLSPRHRPMLCVPPGCSPIALALVIRKAWVNYTLSEILHIDLELILGFLAHLYGA